MMALHCHQDTDKCCRNLGSTSPHQASACCPHCPCKACPHFPAQQRPHLHCSCCRCLNWALQGCCMLSLCKVYQRYCTDTCCIRPCESKNPLTSWCPLHTWWRPGRIFWCKLHHSWCTGKCCNRPHGCNSPPLCEELPCCRHTGPPRQSGCPVQGRASWCRRRCLPQCIDMCCNRPLQCK